jgi:rhodanese-related sulfurtransferase
MKLSRAMLVAFVICVFCPAMWAQEAIAPETVREWQIANKPLNFVDVRSAVEFQKKHISGAINVPHSRILDAQLPKKVSLVLYCTGEGCSVSKAAGGELVQNGYKKVFVLDGGLAEWETKGFPIIPAKSPDAKPATPAGRVSPRDLSKRMKKGEALIIDARPAAEFSAGHVPGAINFPLEKLETRLGELDKARTIVVYDRLSDRSRKAGELLLQKGYTAEELAGGIAVWIAMKLPVEM